MSGYKDYFVFGMLEPIKYVDGITELSRSGFSKTCVLVYVKLGFKNTDLS